MAESIIKTQVLDDVSPEVRKLMDSLSPEGRRKLLRRLAHLFVEDAKRNFDDPANRPEPWADKKVYKRGRGLFSVPSNLKDTGSLLKSIKLKYLDSDSAEISASPDCTDSKGVRHAGYGVFHQEGTSKMPRRPYFSLQKGGNKLTAPMRDEFEAQIFAFLGIKK